MPRRKAARNWPESKNFVDRTNWITDPRTNGYVGGDWLTDLFWKAMEEQEWMDEVDYRNRQLLVPRPRTPYNDPILSRSYYNEDYEDYRP